MEQAVGLQMSHANGEDPHALHPPQGYRLPSLRTLGEDPSALTFEGGVGAGIQYGREGYRGDSRSSMRGPQF